LRLGHATDPEIKGMVDSGITFSKIFTVGDVSNCTGEGYQLIKAGHNTGLVECLKLNEKMEQAAAFLETRRYAAYLGATSESEKFEGLAVNGDRPGHIGKDRVARGGKRDAGAFPGVGWTGINRQQGRQQPPVRVERGIKERGLISFTAISKWRTTIWFYRMPACKNACSPLNRRVEVGHHASGVP